MSGEGNRKEEGSCLSVVCIPGLLPHSLVDEHWGLFIYAQCQCWDIYSLPYHTPSRCGGPGLAEFPQNERVQLFLKDLE